MILNMCGTRAAHEHMSRTHVSFDGIPLSVLILSHRCRCLVFRVLCIEAESSV